MSRVSVTYDALTRQVRIIRVGDEGTPDLVPQPGERLVVVGKGFYSQFTSQEDFGRAVSQLAPFYDNA